MIADEIQSVGADAYFGALENPGFKRQYDGLIEGAPEPEIAYHDAIAYASIRRAESASAISDAYHKKWDIPADEGSRVTTIHSAQLRSHSGQNELGISIVDKIKTAQELSENPPVPTSYMVEGLLPRGALVLLFGPAKEAGKTTFLLRMSRALIQGHPFMGLATEKTPVMLYTEQSRSLESEYFHSAGLWASPELYVAYGYELREFSFQDVVAELIRRCVDNGIKLLVIDTLAGLARISDENDAKAMNAVVRPLSDAVAKYGITILLVHHSRKGGGSTLEAGRGSSALPAAVDQIVHLNRSNGGGTSNIRELRIEGRYSGVIPSAAIELTDSGYICHGDVTAVKVEKSKAHILQTLPSDPDQALRLSDLETKPHSRSTLQRALDSLFEAGRVQKLGRGRKGDPIKYYQLRANKHSTP